MLGKFCKHNKKVNNQLISCCVFQPSYRYNFSITCFVKHSERTEQHVSASHNSLKESVPPRSLRKLHPCWESPLVQSLAESRCCLKVDVCAAAGSLNYLRPGSANSWVSLLLGDVHSRPRTSTRALSDPVCAKYYLYQCGGLQSKLWAVVFKLNISM